MPMPAPEVTDHGIRPEILSRAVPIDSVTPHPRNYRRGNLPLIAESLRVNGQYRPIIVQASTGHICAGNHTWQAARDLGWHLIAADLLDLSDEAALRILAVDNRASDQAVNDDPALAELLRELDVSTHRLQGTGYHGDDLDNLLGQLETALPDGFKHLVPHDEAPAAAPPLPADPARRDRACECCGQITDVADDDDR